MMKKLLVLSLVLGIASLATAGLSFTNQAGLEVNVQGADYTQGVSFFIASAGSTIDVTKLYGGDGSTIAEYSGDAIYTPWIEGTLGVTLDSLFALECVDKDPDNGVILPNGLLTKILASGATTVYIADGSGNEIASVNLVPEPATMALLGLGALVLRRKK